MNRKEDGECDRARLLERPDRPQGLVCVTVSLSFCVISVYWSNAGSLYIPYARAIVLT